MQSSPPVEVKRNLLKEVMQRTSNVAGKYETTKTELLNTAPIVFLFNFSTHHNTHSASPLQLRVYKNRTSCPVGSVYLKSKGTDGDGGPMRVKCANSRNWKGDKNFKFLGIEVQEWRAELFDAAEKGVGLCCIWFCLRAPVAVVVAVGGGGEPHCSICIQIGPYCARVPVTGGRRRGGDTNEKVMVL